MNNLFSQPVIFLLEIILIYVLSKQAITETFHLLRVFFKNDKFIFSLVTVFFLPGTLIHEIAHFFGATVLMLRVREVKIFPEWQKNYIKLGSVLYEKKDFFRGILVGIAPFFAGLFFFWVLGQFRLFPNENPWLNIVFGYLVYVVSSTMFSSPQDLIDIAFIIPLILIVWAIIYVFKIDINQLLTNKKLLENLLNFIREINFYLIFSLAINLSTILVFKSLRRLLESHEK